MKAQYTKPVAEEIKFETLDVVTTSIVDDPSQPSEPSIPQFEDGD